jgi:cysteine-rich repeat protein
MRPALFSSVFALGAIAAFVSCSLVNAPEDALPPGGSGNSGTGSGAQGPGGQGSGGGGGQTNCGNGVEDDGEECDEGGDSPSCDGDCTAVACADGYHNLAANEDCDDGNRDPGDACTPLCKAALIEVDDDAAPIDSFFIQVWPDVAALPVAGGFRIAWVDLNGHRARGDAQLVKLELDGSLSGLVGLSSAAPPGEFGPEVVRMATNGADQSVVVWRSLYDDAARFRRVNSAGNPQGTTDQVIPDTAAQLDGIPDVTAGTDNGFCMSWTRSADSMVMTTMITPSGELAATNTPVTPLASTLGDRALFPSDGGYMLTFIEPLASDVMGLKLAVTGVADGDPFFVTQLDDVSFIGGGFGRPNAPEFVSVFGIQALHGEATEETRSMFRRFSAPDMPIGDEVLASTVHKTEIFNHAAAGPGGAFTIVWSEQDTTADTCTLVARFFEADGTPRGLPFDVSPPEPMICHVLGRTAVTAEGDVIYTWLAAPFGGGGSFGAKVFAKIFPRRLAAD